jgi:hypothetical protein
MIVLLPWCAAIFATASAILWAWSGFIVVPNDQDRFIEVLQRQGRINKWAALAMAVSAATQAIALFSSP